MDFVNASFVAFKMPKFSNKYTIFWRFKCQKCYLKLGFGNWHLKARIW